jgi:outer membrane protein assembly factor BamA
MAKSQGFGSFEWLGRFVGCGLVVLLATAARAQEPEAATRAELLALLREQKAKALQPYEPKGIEKALLYIENQRIIERLTIADGWYPRFGGLTTGGGFAAGVGYRKHLFNDELFLNTSVALSTKAYKEVVAQVQYPRVWNDRIEIGSNFRWRDFPQEDFFGIGADSRLDTRSNYAIESTDINGRVALAPLSWLRVGTEIGLFEPTISSGTDTRMPSTELVFSDADAPGLLEQPSFLYKNLFVEIDYRDQPGNARSGGLWRAMYGAWNDRELNLFDFGRFDAEAAHFFPIFDKKRVFALRAVVSYVNNDPDNRVPFYFLPYVGGSESIRSFREFRFRDENAVFFNIEYRWEAFSGLDMALFADAGKVAEDWEDIDFNDLQTAYGLGFRFNTYKSVFMRLDIGTGGGEGTRLFFKFGPAF